MAKSRAFTMSVTINAKPREVFDALTDAKTISRWSGQKGKVESTIGGKFEFFDGWVKGKVLAYKPGKLLAHTWLPDGWDKDSTSSIVKYTFATAKAGTKVTLKHTGFPNDKEQKEHHAGWTEHVFDPLKEFFESR